MHDPALPLDGQCRCGATRIRITAPPLLTAACHCAGCQGMSASAFSLSAAIPTEGFAVIVGETVLGGLSKDMHHFCPHCLTWMFTRPVGLDFFVNVRPTMFAETGWFAPFVEIFTAEKMAFAPAVAPNSFAGMPDMAGYQQLTADYAKAVGRAG